MSAIISRVAAGANVKKAQAKKVLETLREILKKELQEKDKIFIPGLLSASVRIVPEKPAKAKLCFGKIACKMPGPYCHPRGGNMEGL